MARHKPKHGTGKSFVGSVSVLLVVTFVGFLLITNMRINRTTTVSSDTAELIENRVRKVDKLQADVKELSAQVDKLSAQVQSGQSTPSEDAGSSTMLLAVEGPGVTVTLNDSSMWKNAVDSSGSAVDNDKYVVHQQDVEAVVDALWAGGAESMQIMDQRVLSTSAIICSGNVLLLQGRKYSPPFTISAIGPPTLMIQALDDSRAVQIYRQYVDAYGLGYDVRTESKLHFDSTTMLLQPLQYAHVLQQPNKSENGTDDAAHGDENDQGGAQ